MVLRRRGATEPDPRGALPAADRDRVTVRWRAYELRPHRPAGLDQTLMHALMEERGMTEEQARGHYAQVIDAAAAEGIEINYDGIIASNTFDAHRLVHLAGADAQKVNALLEGLFKARFTDGVAQDDRAALLEIAVAAGLDRDEVTRALDSDAAAAEVRADEKLAADLGVSGVPFFVADRKYAVSGAQPVEVLTQLLQTALTASS